MRHPILETILRWLTVVLIVRVLITIVANYVDYFPPNFESLFLQGREATFAGAYRSAFYIHIFSGPVVLLNGLILLSAAFRRRKPGLHRILGRIQVIILLVLMLPSAMVMSQHAFGGWGAGLSFLILSLNTGICAAIGVLQARWHRYDLHRCWMLRTFVLICSAVVLRLISGAASVIGVEYPETAYIIAAWCSWLLPLATLEIVLRVPYFRTTQSEAK
ncbi:MAG: DUF2306 domain-containing protein [Zavarzinella sp.]